MLKNFVPRLYQETIFGTCILKNTLVVLPTGLGKTAIALMLAIHRLKQIPNSKVLFLAPTKPLVHQHVKTFQEHITDKNMTMFTGEVSPDKRSLLWNDADIVFSTPQCVTGDTIVYTKKGTIPIKEFVESFKLTEKKYGQKKGFFADINQEVLGLSKNKVGFVKATKCWKLPASKIIKIKTELNNKLKCTPEHPLLSINNEGKFSWKKAEELKENMYVAMINDSALYENKQDLYSLMNKTKVRLADKKIILRLFKELKKKGINDKRYNNYVTSSMPLKKFFEDAKKVSLNLPENLLITNSAGKGKPLNLPRYISPDLAYLIGAMLGDGHISNRSSAHGIEVVYCELFYPSIRKKFIKLVKRVFNISPSQNITKKGTIYYSTILAIVLNQLGVPKGSKSHIIRVPKIIFRTKKEEVLNFICGVINADGNFYKHMIRINSVSKFFIKDLQWLLLKIGITSSFTSSDSQGSSIGGRDTKGTKIYQVTISGANNITKILACKNRDFTKSKRIKIQQRNTKNKNTRSKDILPVKNALRIAYKEHRKNGGKTFDEFRVAYSAGYLSKEYLKKWLPKLKSKKAKELLKTMSLPVRWVKIKEIEKSKTKEWVYDLTVEKEHNFISNLLVSHNTVENDVINKKIDLNQVSLLVIDEAHRAVGDYAYVFIAEQYHQKAKLPKILALTASPGSELEKIDDILQNLFIDAVEIRTDKDPDVAPYVQETTQEWVRVTLPEEFKSIQTNLKNCIAHKFKEMGALGLKPTSKYLTKTTMLQMQGLLRKRMLSGDKDYAVLKCISLLAEAMKVQHALELLETQGVEQLNKYFEKIYSDARGAKSKAVQNLIKDLYFKTAFIRASKLTIDHPKLAAVKKIVDEQVVDDKKIILFTQFRDTAVKVREVISVNPAIRAEVFVGQAKKRGTGLSQKEQLQVINKFRNGECNVLIATSVAEEGLDIPAVDAVVFYEPIPSAIRTIQRRGRTGRHDKGKVFMLMTSGTRDEGYHWSAKAKEKKMYQFLEELRTSLDSRLRKKQPTLQSFSQEKIKVFADYREKGSAVVKGLLKLGVDVSLSQLQHADFLVSSRCAIEFKNAEDFANSIIDGRLLQQVRDLHGRVERPVFVVEGDVYLSNIHPNAIRGMLATIAISYGIPVLFTRNASDSVNMILSIARREQVKSSNSFSPHFNKKVSSVKEQQEYLVSALPLVGPALAKELLTRFGSVRNVFLASEDELKKVPGVGDKIALAITQAIKNPYVLDVTL